MKEFLAEHWVSILLITLYAAERFSALSKDWVDRLRTILAAIESGKSNPYQGIKGESADDISRKIKDVLGGDIAIDSILDAGVQTKIRPRVSKGRKILSGALKILPLLSRFAK